MRQLFLIVGGVATAVMLLISMRLNFLFGYSLGQTPEKAWVFGFVSVVSDAWKGLGPIFILALIRTQRWPSAASAASIWIVCFYVFGQLCAGCGDRRSLHAHRQPRESRDDLRRDASRTRAAREKTHRNSGSIGPLPNSTRRLKRCLPVLLKAINIFAARSVTFPTIASAPARARSKHVRRSRTCAKSLRLRTKTAISIAGCRS